MEGHPIHPLVAFGTMFTGVGTLINEWGATLLGFALTILGIWLQRCEHKRHERAMGALRGERGHRATQPSPHRETR